MILAGAYSNGLANIGNEFLIKKETTLGFSNVCAHYVNKHRATITGFQCWLLFDNNQPR